MWPALIRFALPITAWTLGLGALALNGLFVWLAAWILGAGFDVDRVWQGVLLAIWLSVISIIITTVLSIDDDAVVYRSVVKRQMRKVGAIESDVPGVLFLEIDGLGHEVLTRAMRDGNAPNLARWVQEGSHHLVKWETDWSSQTGAAQTGLLLGSNENIPAFRWWDKEQGSRSRVICAKGRAGDRGEPFDGKGPPLRRRRKPLEHVLGGRRALLAHDRDATTAGERHHERRGQGYLAYFSNPFAMVRTIVLMIADMIKEHWNAAEQSRLDVWPRGHRGFVYSLLRAFMVVVQRDLAMSAVIGDIYAGRPVVYATFSGYDEVAHHSGIERPDALAVLRTSTRPSTGSLARRTTHRARFTSSSSLTTARARAPPSSSATARRSRRSSPTPAEAEVVSAEMGDEGMMHLNVTMTAAASGGGAVGVIAKPFAKSTDEDAMTEASEDIAGVGADGKELPEVVTLASGNLGLISFPRIPHRVTLEELAERYPAVIPTLREHPGVAFVVVRSSARGAVAIGKSGLHYLDEGLVEGDDPLAPFGENAARKAKRTDGFSHVADIMVNSTYWAELEEVAAFEELIGSHGGMGGPQQYPFVLVPDGFALPDHVLLGPGTVHDWMRRWLAEVGQDAYADERAAAAV